MQMAFFCFETFGENELKIICEAFQMKGYLCLHEFFAPSFGNIHYVLFFFEKDQCNFFLPIPKRSEEEERKKEL